MLTLEQVKLLETKITRATSFITQVTEENTRLKKRNSELEAIVAMLKEEKTKVEEGIVSTMEKLNQFEDAMERSLSSIKAQKKAEIAGTQQSVPVNSPVSPVTSPAPQQLSTPAAAPTAQPSSAYSIEEEFETLDETELDIF